YEGHEVETAGDSFFVIFASALQAARCAVEIQTRLHARNLKEPPERQILIRIGLHVGDVVHMGKNVHGDKVNITARIQSVANPGGICMSEDMERQIKNQIGARTEKLGKPELKNIEIPMEVWRVVMPWEESRFPWSERMKFKLKQRSVQQVILVVKTLLVSAVLILAGLYVWQWVKEEKTDVTRESRDTLQRTPTEETVSLNKQRIAVLPFVNLSRDEKDEYFSDGMTEEMISQLSKISSLEVIARTSVMTYKGTSKKIDEIGRELEVGAVLEGSVRKVGNQLRITTQLINTQNQAHLWSEDYDRELKDVFVIQGDIAKRVAEALKVQLLAGEKQQIETKGTKNLEAYNLYLKGLYHWNKLTREDLEKSKAYFEQAIEKDPSYAQAYTGLAFSYKSLGFFGFLPAKEAYPKAKDAVIKALELDNTLAEAYTVLAQTRIESDWDWPGAEQAYKRAIELNPSYALAHEWYGHNYLVQMGRFDEAFVEQKRGLELDPLSLNNNMEMCWLFFYARQYDQA
ncbi:MAG: hypothetical protein L0Y56_03700, partial [Nitrospira sp.]|nr:hypothetical protein [Nitrospira sp.]